MQVTKLSEGRENLNRPIQSKNNNNTFFGQKTGTWGFYFIVSVIEFYQKHVDVIPILCKFFQKIGDVFQFIH